MRQFMYSCIIIIKYPPYMKSLALGTALCASLTMGFTIKSETETALSLADPQQCIQEKCPNQWAACQKDSKCIPALQDCEKKCGTKQSCWQLCLPTKGSQAAIDVAKCAAANHCLQIAQVETPSTAIAIVNDPQQCIQEKCPNQWAACQKDPKCIPALQDCEKKCGSKVSCWQLCLPTKGSQAAIDVAKCAAANNCLQIAQQVETPSTALVVADPQQCIQEKCPNQWAACQKDPKCIPALQDCEKKCGSKVSCWQLCLPTKGSQAAIDVAKCASANNCLQIAEVETPSTALVVADPQQCIQEKCPNQWAACQKDPKCIPALQDCEKKCGSKVSCWQLCLPTKGSQAAIDVAKCASANNCLQSQAFPYAFETCMSKTCTNSFAECISDESCRADLRICRNVEKVWDFSIECLSIKSEFNEKLNAFFHCAGKSKCI